MKKLQFELCSEHELLQASGRNMSCSYRIRFMRDNIYSAMADDTELCVGDLYECLDVCNRHHSGILEIKKEHWVLYTTDREYDRTTILGIFDSSEQAWDYYNVAHINDDRYFNIPYVEGWINDKKVSE